MKWTQLSEHSSEVWAVTKVTANFKTELKHEVHLGCDDPEQGSPSTIPPRVKHGAIYESTSPWQLHLLHLVTEKTIWAWATGVIYEASSASSGMKEKGQ